MCAFIYVPMCGGVPLSICVCLHVHVHSCVCMCVSVCVISLSVSTNKHMLSMCMYIFPIFLLKKNSLFTRWDSEFFHFISHPQKKLNDVRNAVPPVALHCSGNPDW